MWPCGHSNWAVRPGWAPCSHSNWAVRPGWVPCGHVATATEPSVAGLSCHWQCSMLHSSKITGCSFQFWSQGSVIQPVNQQLQAVGRTVMTRTVWSQLSATRLTMMRSLTAACPQASNLSTFPLQWQKLQLVESLQLKCKAVGCCSVNVFLCTYRFHSAG
jgi:hypothetical protein